MSCALCGGPDASMQLTICSPCHDNLTQPLTTTAVEWSSDIVAAAARARSARPGARPAPVCSFCGRKQGEVKKLLAGNDGVSICDGCIDLCRHILESGE